MYHRSVSNQRVVVGGLIATIMFLVGGVAVLVAQGWIRRPSADAPRGATSTSEPVIASAVGGTMTTAPTTSAASSTTPTLVSASPPSPVLTTTAPPLGVRGDATTGALVTSAPVQNAERTIAGLRPGFRRCYNTGLATDPTMSGKIVLAVKLDPNGDVVRIDKVDGSGLSSAVESCITARAKQATFDAPGGSGATIQIPVTFVSSSGSATRDPFGGRE